VPCWFTATIGGLMDPIGEFTALTIFSAKSANLPKPGTLLISLISLANSVIPNSLKRFVIS
jgi:hypothetical protein